MIGIKKHNSTLAQITSRTNICLYGPPGAGKTTVSIELGKILNMEVYDVDDDHLEMDWGMSVADKLKELGDEGFIKAEGGNGSINSLESIRKINKTNTIISLTGSVPLNEEAIKFVRRSGILVYLDIDKQAILNRLHKMKVNRIVGQSTKSLSDILDYRKSIYEKYYDLRISIDENESVDSITKRIIDVLNRPHVYISTRGMNEDYHFLDVIREGLAKDRGLFVPEFIPSFNLDNLRRMINMSYEERSLRIIEQFPMGETTPQTLYEFILRAYSSFNNQIIPVTKLEKNQYIMEQYYGPTASFKDLALQLFPLFFQESIKNSKEKNVILVATSGDTGSAVLSGFQGTSTSVVVLYPHGGVSPLQESQMITAEGNNAVIGVKADFDFCQNTVKDIFNDIEFTRILKEEHNVSLTSANSINWGRLLPQVCYTISSYLDLVKSNEIKFGDKINVCIPSGNFGHILGAWIAKKMGLPLNKLVCASNENKIITDFINTGQFNLNNRTLKDTCSPAIDILNPSNIERLLYFITKDSKKVKDWYDELKSKGMFTIDPETLSLIQKDFEAYYCPEEKCIETIKTVYERTGFLLDPHTSVAKYVVDQYLNNEKVIIASTAHFAKFPEIILKALGLTQTNDLKMCFDNLEKINSKPKIPDSLRSVLTKQILHRDVLEADQTLIKNTILEKLRLNKI